MKWKPSRKVRIIGLLFIVLAVVYVGYVGMTLIDYWGNPRGTRQKAPLEVSWRFPFVYIVRQGRWSGPAAITSLRQYLNAQGTYHRTDYDGDGIKEYAADLDDLYDWDGPGGEEPIKLIDHAMAKADVELFSAREQDVENGYDGRCYPRASYFFADLPKGRTDSIVEDQDKPPLGLTDSYAFIAFPAEYGGDHKYSYIITESGMVYRKKIRAPEGSFSTDLLPDHVPDFKKDGWKFVQ